MWEIILDSALSNNVRQQRCITWSQHVSLQHHPDPTVVKPLLVFSFSPKQPFFLGNCCDSNGWTLWFLHWLMWLVITVYAADTSGSCFCMLTCHEHKLLSWRFISSAAHTDLVYLKLQPQGLSVYQLLLPSPQLLQLFSACSYDTLFLVFIC